MMDSVTDLLLYLFAACLILYSIKSYWKCYHSIPGPWGLPILGYLPFLALRNSRLFSKQSKLKIPLFLYRHQIGETYRHIGFYATQFGAQRIIILQTYDAIKEALVDNAEMFSHRPNLSGFTRATLGLGLIFNSKDVWKLARSFSLMTLKNLGLGRTSMEPAIQIEATELVKALEKSEGQLIHSQEYFTRSVSNVVCQLVFGERSGFTDPQFLEYIHLVKSCTTQQGIWPMLEFCFPALSSWPLLNPIFEKTQFQKSYLKLKNITRGKIDAIRNTYNFQEEPTNYVEAFLKEFVQNKIQEDVEFALTHCSVSTVDLFIAGSDTTSTFLQWAMLYLAIHSHVQDKVFQEISHVQLDQPISISLRPDVPYICAFIDEVQRMTPNAPLSVDRAVKDAFSFRGYTFYPNDMVMTNIYSVHHDPALWTHPEVFQPERFLNDDGMYQPSKYLLTFGLGKRQCLGKDLAKMEIFIFLCSLMRRFRVELAPHCHKDLEQILLGKDGLLWSPGYYELILHQR